MTLIVVLVVTLALSVMGGVAVSFAQSNEKSAERSSDTSVSDAVAEAAMSHARSILWSAPNPLDPNAVPTSQVKLFGGTGTYSGQLSGNVWTLTGVSHVTSGAQEITRTVSTQVAVEAGGDGPPVAVFSADSDCGGDSFTLNPDTTKIEGAVRSNGDLVIGGTDVSIGHVSAYGPPCVVQVDSPTAELQTLTKVEPIDSDVKLVNGVAVDSTVHYWPAAFDEADFVCTYRDTVFKFSQKGLVIPEGVYCAEESFTIVGNNLTGKITVLAPLIEVHGAGHKLVPYQREVLFYATDAAPMDLAGTSYAWEGIIYHPSGQVAIAGDEFSMLIGMIEAREVQVDGKAFRMIGTGPAAVLGGDGLTLAEVPGSYTAN